MIDEDYIMTKFYCQANARSQKEVAIFEMLEKASDYLVETLGLQDYLKEVRIERMNGWGQTSTAYSGKFIPSKRIAKVNIRTLYGVAPRMILEVLCHELRHAVQYMQQLECLKGSYSRSTYHGPSYYNLSWEIDAREFQGVYADMVIEALGLNMEIEATTDKPIIVWDSVAQRKELEERFGCEVGFVKSRKKKDTIKYIALCQIGKKYRKLSDAAYRYVFDNQMELLNSQEVPRLMRELTESERLVGY